MIKSGLDPDAKAFNMFFMKSDASISPAIGSVRPPGHVKLLFVNLTPLIIRRLLIRSDRFRLEREFAGPDFHRGERCALPRHTEQSGREFASTDTTARAQDAAFQIARISPALPVHSRRRPKHFQRPAPSHIPPHAPRPQRRSVPDVASRHRGLKPERDFQTSRRPNLSSCDSALCTMGQVARGGARPTDPRSREACPLEMSMKSASRRTRVHPGTLNYPIA